MLARCSLGSRTNEDASPPGMHRSPHCPPFQWVPRLVKVWVAGMLTQRYQGRPVVQRAVVMVLSLTVSVQKKAPARSGGSPTPTGSNLATANRQVHYYATLIAIELRPRPNSYLSVDSVVTGRSRFEPRWPAVISRGHGVCRPHQQLNMTITKHMVQ